MENMKCGKVWRSRVWRRSGKCSDIWIVMECTNDVHVCGMRSRGEQSRKGTEWWNEEVCGAVTEKKSALILRNDCRKEKGLPMTDTGHRE